MESINYLSRINPYYKLCIVSVHSNIESLLTEGQYLYYLYGTIFSFFGFECNYTNIGENHCKELHKEFHEENK